MTENTNEKTGDVHGKLDSLVECDHGLLKKQLELRDAELERAYSQPNPDSVKWSISQQRAAIKLLIMQLAPNVTCDLQETGE